MLVDRRPRSVKFVRLDLEQLPGNRCRARVELERQPGQTYVGTADGRRSKTGKLRCTAQAAADALRQAVGADEDAFELLELKTVTVLETTAVIVALSVHHQNETWQLVGFCLTAQHPTRAPALAVLNATNRFLDTG